MGSKCHKYKIGVTSIKILSNDGEAAVFFPFGSRKFRLMNTAYISKSYTHNLWIYGLHFFDKVFFAVHKLPFCYFGTVRV